MPYRNQLVSNNKHKTRLQILREKKGLTRKGFAEQTGAHEKSVANWEAGHQFAAEKIPAIEQALGVTIEELDIECATYRARLRRPSE